MTAAMGVGRVGGLAVALGVGAALAIGLPAVAAADPADTAGAASASSSPETTNDSSRPNRAARGGPRASLSRPSSRDDSVGQRSATRPGFGAGTATPQDGLTEPGPVAADFAPESALATRDSSHVIPDPVPAVDVSALAVIAPTSAADGIAPPVTIDLPTPITGSINTASPPPAASWVSSEPVAAATVPTTTVTPLSAVADVASPVIAVATAQPTATNVVTSVIGVALRSALAPLLGLIPGTPVESPVAWTVLAASRRLSDQQQAATIPAAATASEPLSAQTTTNQPPEIGHLRVDSPNPVSGVVTGAITATDADGDTLTYGTTKARFGTAAVGADGTFTYKPRLFAQLLVRIFNLSATDSFAVTVNDGHGGTSTVNVTAAIAAWNRAPVAGGASISAPDPVTGLVTGVVKAKDPEWDPVSFVASSFSTDKGAVTVNGGGGFSYTPTATARHDAAATSATAAVKTDTFTVTAIDRYGATVAIPVTVSISPTNTAPTGTATVGSPDDISGIVTGTVSASDADGDTVTYSGSTTTSKGTVVITADGEFSYTPTDIARSNAAASNATVVHKTDTFSVTLVDGYGGTTVVPVSVVISPNGEPTTIPLTTFCGCVLMPADTIFHADVSGLPVMSESDIWIDLLGGNRGATLDAHWGGPEWMGSTGGMPVNIVSADRPTELVVFNRGYSTTGPGIDNSPYAIPDYPLVEGMPSQPAWDRHLLVFQEGTCISQELYNVANGVELPAAGVLDAAANAVYAAIWGSTWIAEGGVKFDMSSPLYPVIGAANAAMLPYLPMILRPDDLERGYIDHMLGIVIAKDVGAGYVWPALHGDGSAEDGIPMGMVFRLRGDIDISGYAPSTQVVLRALQQHGAVIYDSRGAGTEGAGLLAMSNGWENVDYKTAQRELNTIPMSFFEAVDVAGLAVDPAISWQIH